MPSADPQCQVPLPPESPPYWLQRGYNLESVDRKMKQKEFVVASPQQQQVIASFTASSTKRHLVLESPAGTGKTLVALQVANNLLESIKATADKGKGPLLIVTAQSRNENAPLMKYLHRCQYWGWSQKKRAGLTS